MSHPPRAGASQGSSSQRGREQGANAPAPALGGAVSWAGRPRGRRSSRSEAHLRAHPLGCAPNCTAHSPLLESAPRLSLLEGTNQAPRVHGNLFSRDAEYLRGRLGSEGDLTWFHTRSGTADTGVRSDALHVHCLRQTAHPPPRPKTALDAAAGSFTDSPTRGHLLRSPGNQERREARSAGTLRGRPNPNPACRVFSEVAEGQARDLGCGSTRSGRWTASLPPAPGTPGQ